MEALPALAQPNLSALDLLPHQHTVLDACMKSAGGIVKMFCGTGKICVMLGLLACSENPITLVVLPWIPVLEQFKRDYIMHPAWGVVVSEFETTFVSTIPSFSIHSRVQVVGARRAVVNYCERESI
jgi:hypothetical protein